MAYFKDRADAGKKLANLLAEFKGKDAIVYALPRGGVIVANEIAKKLQLPLDLIITRKISHPRSPEYAIGAVAENGHSIFNEGEKALIDKNYLTLEIEKQRKEAQRRREIYLGDKKTLSSDGKIAILVDDGVATGLTVKVAIKELQAHYRPAKIIVAVPIIPAEIGEELEKMGSELVTLHNVSNFFGAIGAYYKNFPSIEDEEVVRITKKVV